MNEVKRVRTQFERSLYPAPSALSRNRQRLTIAFFRVAFISLLTAAFGGIFDVRVLVEIGIVAAGAFGFTAFLGWALTRFRSRQRLDVTPTELVLDHGDGRCDRFLWNEIEHVRLTSIPLLFSAIRIEMRDGRTLRLLTSWERFDYVLDSIAGAQPELAKLPSWDAFRRRCILADHSRSRLAQDISFREFLVTALKMISTPVLAGALIVGMKRLGLLEGIIPQDEKIIYHDTFLVSAAVWFVWACFQEWSLHRSHARKLEADRDNVRRSRMEEAKFIHSYGIQSWLAFWAVTAIACAGAVFGIS